MARTIDAAAHAVRREAFVDAAQRLFLAKGYESTSVQDVLDETEASRGAFYHYFTSKSDLVEAVVERMADDAIRPLGDALADPDRSAVAKLDLLFLGIARFKTEQRELVEAIAAWWTSDDNALVREKLRTLVATRLTPILAPILEQGVREGMHPAGSPGDAALVINALIRGAQDAALELWLARRAGTVTYDEAAATFAAFGEAFERVLGVPSGSLTFFGPDVVRPWFG